VGVRVSLSLALDEFLGKLLLSFLVGGTWIGLSTTAAERFGTKVGGIVANLPTTARISLFFIGWSQGVETAAQASLMVPAVMGLNAVFLLVYAITLPRGYAPATLSALMVWFLLAALLVTSRLSDIAISTAIFLLLASSSFILLEYGLKVQSQKIGHPKHGLRQLLYRGLLAGSFVAFAVYMSRIGGAWLGGLFSTFPAIYLSVILIFGREHSSSVGKAMAKSMIVGSNAICVFGIAVNLGLRTFGLGMVLGYACSLGVATMLMFLMRQAR